MPDFLSPSEMMGVNFEPKTQHHFILYIEGIPSFLVKTSKKPNVSFGDIVLDHINVKRKLKGKADWGDLSMTLYDPIIPSGAQAVMEWIRLGHESVTGRDGYADFYKKDLTMVSIGPPGDIVETWKIKGAYLASFDAGDLDWSSDQPVMISITIKMDYCELEF